MMRKVVILAGVLLCSAMAAVAPANLLLNGDFELGELGQLGSVTVDNWITWGNSGWHHSDDGLKFDDKGIKLWWDATGIYQDFTAAVGAEFLFEVYAITSQTEALKGWDAVVKAEWLDASWQFVAGEEIGRFYGEKDDKGIAGDPISTWKLISGSATAPEGAAYGRIVMVLEQADNWQSTTGGAIYWDNASVVMVPEPLSLALLGAGALCLRRKK